jgi:surface antigen
MTKDNDDDIKCYIKHCKKEMDKSKNDLDRIINKKNNKLYDDYKKHKISQKEFIKKAIRNHKKLFNSIQRINLHNCQLDKCYKYVKKRLDKASDEINVKKKNNYNINDFNNIFKILFKKNIKKL